MASPVEILEGLQDRLSRLPEEVASAVSQAAKPDVPADAPAEAAAGVAEAVSQAMPSPASAAFEGFASAAPESPVFGGVGEAALPSTPEVSLGGGEVPESPEYDRQGSAGPERPDYEPYQREGLRETEQVSLLREIAESLRGNDMGKQPQGRTPPRPHQKEWNAVWQEPGEGFAGGASPSMDVSNVAGAGGASSRRGYGTDPTNRRYWHPETDADLPR